MNDFKLIWNKTDHIFSTIQNIYNKPINLRHPYIFYKGHIPCFNKIKLLNYHHPYDNIFTRGIDPIVTDPTKCHKHSKVPTIYPTDLDEYIKQIRKNIINNIENLEYKLIKITQEHELMHQETLQYIQIQDKNTHILLSINNQIQPIKKQKLHIKGGNVHLGCNKSKEFKWDNEIGNETVHVNDFIIDNRPILNYEYMEFIDANGYTNPDLWDNFQFIINNNIKYPASWSYDNEQYYVHTPLYYYKYEDVNNWCVYVSKMEADAYCKWKDGRLMTEAEYEIIPDKSYVKYDYPVVPTDNNLKYNGWELTSTIFKPFSGFKECKDYPEYSVDFFDGLHYVLKGSSPYTPEMMVRDSFRNFYQGMYRYMIAKFRLVYKK